MMSENMTPGPDAEPVGGTLEQRLAWLRRVAVQTESDQSISPKPGTTTIGHTTVVMVLEALASIGEAYTLARARLATSEAERERYRVLLTDVVQSADASLSNRKPSSLIHVPKSVMDSVRDALAASPVSDTDRQGEGS